MEAGGRRPPLPPARDPTRYPRCPTTVSPRFQRSPLQSAGSLVPPECANTESFCPRHGAQHKTASSPVQVRSRRVIWGCQGYTGACHAQADTIWTPTHTNEKLSGSKQPCQARRGANIPQRPPPTTAPTSSAGGNPKGPPRQFLAHLRPPPSWLSPTPGHGVVFGSLALVCPAGNDPQCCTVPLCSLKGIYFDHPSPPAAPRPLPRQSWGPSLELPSRLFRPLPRHPPPAARPRAPPGSPSTHSQVPGGPAPHGQSPPHYLEAAGGACTCNPSSRPGAACRCSCCVASPRASESAAPGLPCASVCASLPEASS